MKFKPGNFTIKNELDKGDGVRVVKLDMDTKPAVKDFQFNNLNPKGQGGYAAVKAKYGALAVTDPERKQRSQKDARFSLNPLLRDPLSVEEEERRAIDERVRERVAALEAEVSAKAREEGYQAGLQQGHEEAFSRFQEEGGERLARLDALVGAMENAKAEIFQANERFLIEMIYRISKMVMLKELAVDKEYLSRLAKDLIDRVGVRENITLRISAADLDTIGMLRENIERTIGAMKNLNIEVSPEVQQGGCQLETEWNAIDASLEMQLKGLHDALVGGEDSSLAKPAPGERT